MNLDEAVAYGAAVQGSILSRGEESCKHTLIDACPSTLGIETRGGVMVKVIPR